MKDALNNDIVIGKTYGASYANDGKHVIVVGEAVKINKSKTTLKVTSGKYIGRYDRDWRNLNIDEMKPVLHYRLLPVVDLEKQEVLDRLNSVMGYYTDKAFDDSDLTVMEVLRHNNPKLVSDVEDSLRKLINELS